MKKKNVKKYRTKRESNNYEKRFITRFIICSAILLSGLLLSKTDGSFERTKTYISTVLEESTDIKKTEKDIAEAFAKIKTRLSDKKTIPVDKFKRENTPMASEKNDAFIINAQASEEIDGSGAETASVPDTSTVIMRNPADGVISSVFGMRTHPVTSEEKYHNGIDIAGQMGQTVIAAAPGIVSEAGFNEFNGNYVIINHNDDLQTIYAHLNKLCVVKDERVDDNTKIGEMGDTGLATGVNLHFEVKFKGEKVNPEDYVTLPHKN